MISIQPGYKPLFLIKIVIFGALVFAISAGGCKKKQKEAPTSESEKTDIRLKVLSIPSETAKSIDVRILVNAGSVDDPKGKEGLTYLTAKMMTEGGTKKRSYSEMLGLLYPMAASIDVDVDKEMTVFVGRAHEDHKEKYFSLLYEVLTQPGWDKDDFKRIKDETLNYIQKRLRQADDEMLSREALDVKLYEEHPYGHVVEGTVKGLKNITLEDVMQHYSKIITQDRITIGLAGAVNEALQKEVVQNLSSLPEKGAEQAEIPDAKKPDGLEVVIVEKTTDSTAITMGVPVGVKREDKDFYPLMLAFSCLGEHRQSMGRLFKTIREVRGLNYGDYAYIEHFIQQGYTTKPMVNVARSKQEMSVWLRPVQHKHKILALKLALYELKKFVEKGLTQEELDRTRGFLLGYTRILEESLTRRLGYALDDLFYKIPPYLKTARKAFEKMTLQEINAAIKRNISVDDLKIVIITQDGEELKKQLSDNEMPDVQYDTPKSKDVLEEDEIIRKFDPKFQPEKINVIPVDYLFE